MNYFIALGIPLILILLGAIAKKIVRGSQWIKSDFFLGVELSLSAVASSLIYIFEISNSRGGDDKAIALGVFSVTCLLLFFVVMAVHQDWERETQNCRGQLIWLGGFGNLIGIGLLFSFVLFVKGIGQ